MGALIGQLPCLRHLNLEGCEYLKELPESIGQLPSLRHLNLEGCKYLKELPESIGQLTTLYHLNVHDCVNLKRFPKPIAQLTTLGRLNMRGCINLKLLPEQLGDMKCLKLLDVSYTAIEQLPDSIAHLKKLVYLDLKGCEKLRKLPEQFGNMEGLQLFEASGSSIEQLPDSFSNLLNLVSLNLRECSQLKRLPEQLGNMQCLKHLDASHTAIEEIPDSIGLLRRIQLLEFLECWKLTYVPDSINNLTSLETLYLDHKDMRRIELPFAADNVKLEKLDLSCNIRVWLPVILSFSSLKVLHLEDQCESLSPTIPFSFFKLSSLKKLVLIKCTSHGSSFPELPLNLISLEVVDHASLEQVPDLSHLRQLKDLQIKRCRSLQSLQKLPPHLVILTVLDCTSLQDLPDLSMLRYLRSMDVQRNSSTLKVNLKNSHLQVGRDELFPFRAGLQNSEIAEWFDYKNSGRTVSFDIPPNLGDKFVGVALWVVFRCNSYTISGVRAVITNITEGTTDTYRMPYNMLDYVQSSVQCLIRGGEHDISIKSGDKVEVSFHTYTSYVHGRDEIEVKMCGAHVILETPSVSIPFEQLQQCFQFASLKDYYYLGF